MKRNWNLKKLGDVCNIINGGTPKSTISDYWNGHNLWITPKDMGKLDSIYVEETERKISDKGLLNSSAKLFPEYSVILSSRAPIGHLAINTKPISTNQGCKGIVPSHEINYLYLYYFLRTSIQLLNSLGTGTTFKELSSSKLSDVKVPLPSLEEQKQIVAKLDQAFAAIDTAKLNVEKNLENAKELFQSKLNEIFSQKGEEWTEKKLSEVCDINPPKRESKLRLEDEDLVSFVPMKHLGVLSQCVVLEENRRLESVYSSYTYFSDNDVLLAKITPCFENGKLGIANNLTNGIGFGSSEFVVYRPSKSIESEFLFYFFCRDKYRKDGENVMTGAVGHKRIPKDYIFDCLIGVPSIGKQKEIIKSLDLLKTKIHILESRYQQELNSLEELKKSILEKAFNGEL